MKAALIGRDGYCTTIQVAEPPPATIQLKGTEAYTRCYYEQDGSSRFVSSDRRDFVLTGVEDDDWQAVYGEF